MSEDERFNGKKPPSVRRVTDLIREAREKTAEERLWVDAVTWPESFGGREFPWEAAGAFFELSGELNPVNDRLKRPLQPVMTWFWRLTQAGVDASPQSRRWMAVDLAFWQRWPSKGSEVDRRTIEAYLSWAPWRRDETYQEVQEHYQGRWPPGSIERDFSYRPKSANLEREMSGEDLLEYWDIKYGAQLLGPVHSWLREMVDAAGLARAGGLYVDDLEGMNGSQG